MIKDENIKDSLKFIQTKINHKDFKNYQEYFENTNNP